jgi:hypothetical protein
MVMIRKHYLRSFLHCLFLIFIINLPVCWGMEEDARGQGDAPQAPLSASLGREQLKVSQRAEAAQSGDSNPRVPCVLHIDGQGKRVIVALYQIAVLELLTKKRVYELFDVISGVGSGGFAAWCLSYKKEGKIFTALEVLQFFTEFDKTLYADNFFEMVAGEGKFEEASFAVRTIVLG